MYFEIFVDNYKLQIERTKFSKMEKFSDKNNGKIF